MTETSHVASSVRRVSFRRLRFKDCCETLLLLYGVIRSRRFELSLSTVVEGSVENEDESFNFVDKCVEPNSPIGDGVRA